MQITRNTIETTPGPSEWFTGAVSMVFLVICMASSRRWFDSSVRPICRRYRVGKPQIRRTG